MDRLTKYLHDESFFDMQDTYSTKNKKQAINKLGKLEDIMEKYGIESVEELDITLDGMTKVWQAKCNAEHDRDTWKKACEAQKERKDDR